MEFNYYYGTEADQFTFIRIPKVMMTDPMFAGLSIQAKVLYGLLLDRMGLSVKNHWLDENNRVFIIYQISEIQEDMGYSKKKSMEFLNELETIGLVEKRKRGFGLPSILYVKNFILQETGTSRGVDLGTSGSDVKEASEEEKDDEAANNEEKTVEIITDKAEKAPKNDRIISVSFRSAEMGTSRGVDLVTTEVTTREPLNAVIQGHMDCNEDNALQEMIDRSNIRKALVIADRGYESYNNMAHIQEKGWYFLIRIKDGKTGIKEGLTLPNIDEFDVKISLKITRRQTKKTKELFMDKNHYRFLPSTATFDYLPLKSKKHDPIQFYTLNFRIVRFKVTDDLYETVLTNLDADSYSSGKLKELYASRWSIETSFRDLKYTIGMLDFHSKKVMCIHQEIYSRLIMYNFAEMITSHVVIEKKQRKYTYKANFTVAAHMSRLFYQGKTTSPNLETIISQNIIPVRPDRHRERKLTAKIFHGFLYRVA